MLELRPSCEGCGKTLPPNASDAMITYECTFCEACALTSLRNICPNCGGNFQHRPIRPKAMLAKHPAATERHAVGVDGDAHAALFERYRELAPTER